MGIHYFVLLCWSWLTCHDPKPAALTLEPLQIAKPEDKQCTGREEMANHLKFGSASGEDIKYRKVLDSYILY